jgi:hypothetical protein
MSLKESLRDGHPFLLVLNLEISYATTTTLKIGFALKVRLGLEPATYGNTA